MRFPTVLPRLWANEGNKGYFWPLPLNQRKLSAIRECIMTIRVGINGFGRIGRMALRAAWGRLNALRFVHINDIVEDAACSAHLLLYDSAHGKWDRSVRSTADAIIVEGQRIRYSVAHTPSAVDWRGLGVDLLLECSGTFKTIRSLQPYFDQGIKKVVVSAPVHASEALNVVMGVNDARYDPARHHVVTAASCTTNGLAPVVQVILDNLGIHRASMTTIHSTNNTQSIVDRCHEDLRRARAFSLSMIPTSSSAVQAIIQLFPELTGKMDGLAVRVPLLNASLVDMVFEVKRSTCVAEVNSLLKSASEGHLKGFLGYEVRPLVSIDYVNDVRSSIVDAASTRVIDGTHVKILSWYDNETGYANRLVELAQKIAGFL